MSSTYNFEGAIAGFHPEKLDDYLVKTEPKAITIGGAAAGCVISPIILAFLILINFSKIGSFPVDISVETAYS